MSDNPSPVEALDAMAAFLAMQEAEKIERMILDYFHGDEALARLWSTLFRETRMEVVLCDMMEPETMRYRYFVGMEPEIEAWITLMTDAA